MLDRIEKVVPDFIEFHAKRNTRDWRETERLLTKEIVGTWCGKRLGEISRADVHAMLDKIVGRGAPVGANRTFAAFRKMCSWAIERGIIEKSPCDGLRPPSAERPRDRVLSENELKQVWSAAGKLGWPFGPIVQLLALTGQRRDEVAGMRWSELDLDNATWTLPAERCKNRRAHTVPLSPQAVAILRGLPRIAGPAGLVFSSTGTTAPSGFSLTKRRLDKGISEANGGSIQPFVLHDIRRSVASGMAAIEIDLHVIERALNHVSGTFAGIVSVYQKHRYEAEVRRALEVWGRRVESLVSGEPAGSVIDSAAARA